MHSRTIKATLHNYFRVGMIASSLAGGVVADGMGPAHPMSGACFLHDSGLEYIPDRILDHEDISIPFDRNEQPRWTCADPFADCELYAQRRERQIEACKAWERAFSIGQALSEWSGDAVARTTVKYLQQWNASLAGLGRDLVKRFSIDSNPDPDCPWDRLAAGAPMTCSKSTIECESIIREQANIFVFTLGTKLGCHPVTDAEEEHAAPEVALPEVAPVASPSDRPLPGLSGTTFARDYCIFAPYPLDDAIAAHPQLEAKSLAVQEATSVLKLKQLAGVRLQRSLSRKLAKDMNWMGHALLRWSSQLESSVRIAEASDGPWMDEIK